MSRIGWLAVLVVAVAVGGCCKQQSLDDPTFRPDPEFSPAPPAAAPAQPAVHWSTLARREQWLRGVTVFVWFAPSTDGWTAGRQRGAEWYRYSLCQMGATAAVADRADFHVYLVSPGGDDPPSARCAYLNDRSGLCLLDTTNRDPVQNPIDDLGLVVYRICQYRSINVPVLQAERAP